nr:hypothetical protein MF5293_00458 [Mycoplasma feriruminatoris]
MFNSTVADSMWQKGIQTTNLDWKTLTSNFANAYAGKNNLNDLVKDIKDTFTKANVKNWNDAKIITFTNMVNGLGGISEQNSTSGSGSNNTLTITYSSAKDVQKKIAASNSGQTNGEEWIKEVLRKVSDNANSGSIAFSQWNPSYNYDAQKGPKDFINYNNQKPTSWTEIVKEIPLLENGELKIDPIKGEYGAISNSQKYAINNYFNSEKPVVFSDLIFKFSNNKTSSDIEKNLSLKSLIPTEVSGQDLTTKLIERFQGIQSVLQTYVGNDSKKDQEPYTAGLSRFDTVFRGEDAKIKANTTSNKSTDFKNWTEWDTKNDHHKINANGKLLTLSDTTYSDTLKFSIYDFLTNNNNSNNLWQWKDESNGPIEPEKFKEMLVEGGLSNDEASKIDSAIQQTSMKNQSQDAARLTIYNLAELFKKINQKNNASSAASSTSSSGSSSSSSSSNTESNNGINKNSNIYTILNKEEGIIAFIDGDGLHITKIDGYKLINNKTTQPSVGAAANQSNNNNSIKQTAVLKQIRSLYSTTNASVLVPYLINSALENNTSTTLSSGSSSSSGTTSWDWTEKDKANAHSVKNLGIDINSLNANINNDYERFLINTSLIDNSKTKPFYNIDILSEVSKSIQSGSDASLQANWLIELFTKVLKNDQKKEVNLLNTIISTENPKDNNEIEKIFLYQAKNLKVSGIRKLQQANQKWVSKVKENYKKYSKDPSLNKKFIPDQVIDLNSDINSKKRYDLLLQSQIFNPEIKAQNNNASGLSSGGVSSSGATTTRGDV